MASTSTVRMNPVMRLVSVASAIDPDVLTMLASESRARPVDDESSVLGVSVSGVLGLDVSASRAWVAVDAGAAARAALAEGRVSRSGRPARGGWAARGG
nr:hypothetical protein [Gordonia jacobaea]